MSVINLQTQRVTAPAAFVTKGRQRVRQYGESVYLRNGDEFELELFNPTINKVLAKINLNGKYLGNGIVLRPGERVFLERYLDEARKFMFETYEVNGADPNVREAIRNNGEVEVQFFDEYKPSPWTYTYTYNPCWSYNGGYPNYVYPSHTELRFGCRGNSGPSGPAGVYNSGGTAQGNSAGCFTNSVGNPVVNDDGAAMSFADNFNPIETGRVEKGANSNQVFNTDTTTFNSYWSWRNTWKILPESNRPLLKEDLKVFCTNCGAKRKKSSHMFCPNCGARF